MDWQLIRWLQYYGYYLMGQWTQQIYIKVPTRYFTDTGGNIYTA